MSSGGAALMAVQVLVDHGVPQKRIVFVTYFAGKMGLNRLTQVFPEVKVVVCKIVADYEERVSSSRLWSNYIPVSIIHRKVLAGSWRFTIALLLSGWFLDLGLCL